MLDFPDVTVERQTHPGLSPRCPFVLTYEYSEKSWRNFHADSHYALQICVVLSGEVEVVMPKFGRSCRPGEMWWTMCWEPHAYRMAARRNMVLAVNLDMELLGNGMTFDHCHWLLPFIIDPGYRFNPESEERRRECLQTARRLFHLHARRPRNWRTVSWLLIHQFILGAVNDLEDRYPEMTTRNGMDFSFSRIQPVLKHIWQKKMPPSLGDAARLCALGTSRFSEIFRRSLGVSYGKFALHVRMANASRELLANSSTLDEIARNWGFYDAPHFCHTFRKFYRVSPSEFKSLRN